MSNGWRPPSPGICAQAASPEPGITAREEGVGIEGVRIEGVGIEGVGIEGVGIEGVGIEG